MKHNAAQPFIISVGQVQVKVLGASFNIKAKAGETEVIVEKGLVSVSIEQNKLLLQTGEKVKIARNAIVLKKEPNTDKLYRYYIDAKVTAVGVPLSRVADILNDAYGIPITIAQNKLGDLPVNINISRGAPLQRVLANITKQLPLSMKKQGKSIVLDTVAKSQSGLTAAAFKQLLNDPNKLRLFLKSYQVKDDSTTEIGKKRIVLRNVIHDIIRQKIVPDGGVKSFWLNESFFKVNDQQLPETTHQFFKNKYIKEPGFTIYYGDAPKNGKGIFMRTDSL